MIILTDTKEIADTLLAEISETPAVPGGIGCVTIGVYIQDTQGRCAVCHPWSSADREVIANYFRDVPGVQVLDSLPVDWQYPVPS